MLLRSANVECEMEEFEASWICSRFPAVMFEMVQQLSLRMACLLVTWVFSKSAFCSAPFLHEKGA